MFPCATDTEFMLRHTYDWEGASMGFFPPALIVSASPPGVYAVPQIFRDPESQPSLLFPSYVYCVTPFRFVGGVCQWHCDLKGELDHSQRKLSLWSVFLSWQDVATSSPWCVLATPERNLSLVNL